LASRIKQARAPQAGFMADAASGPKDDAALALVAMDDRAMRFRWKDYRTADPMTYACSGLIGFRSNRRVASPRSAD
jgi:hypothetical protein